MTEALILISFVVGLIPAAILLFMYGFRTAWTVTPTGRIIFALLIVTTGTYILSVLTLLFPDVFRASGGEWIRIAGRGLFAVILWSLLFLFFKVQGIGARRKNR